MNFRHLLSCDTIAFTNFKLEPHKEGCTLEEDQLLRIG